MAEREILFRGKRKDNGEWETGSLVVIRPDCSDQLTFIADKMTGYHTPVIPETRGQFTGLTDTNGKRIFEGDIVEVHYNPSYGGVAKERIGIFIVEFYKGCFMKRKNGTSTYYHFIPSDEHTIIGNIHDNPELLQKI